MFSLKNYKIVYLNAKKSIGTGVADEKFVSLYNLVNIRRFTLYLYINKK